MKRWSLYAALLLAAACASRCSCGSDEDLAELTTVSGLEIDRDHAAHEGSWQLAVLGERFRIGDGLRTGKASSAELALLPSGQAHVEPHTLLRFLAAAPESRQVSIETGAVTIVAQHIDLEIHTPRAIAKIPRGAKLKLSANEGRERFDVLVGRVVVAHGGVLSTVEQTAPLELAPQATAGAPLAAANALPQPTPEESAAPALPDPLPPEPATPAPAPGAQTQAQAAAIAPAAPGPTRVADAAANGAVSFAQRERDLSLPRLESATIHVAVPPLAVWLPAPACDDHTRLQLDGVNLASDGQGALAQLGPGLHNLRVQCGGEVRKVRLLVKRDAAKMDLPKRAQNVRVEADGRRYTVRYQNLLPVVSFSWPGEHPGTLHLLVRKAGRETNYTLTRPDHALPSGTLGEGEYKFLFLDARGNASPVTTLRLSFDNTARSAYLSSPADGSSVGADGVEVSGAALSRSRVQVQDRAVEIDDKGRFQTRVTPRAGEQAVTVRVEHPEGGVHYYVRRVR